MEIGDTKKLLRCSTSTVWKRLISYEEDLMA